MSGRTSLCPDERQDGSAPNRVTTGSSVIMVNESQQISYMLRMKIRNLNFVFSDKLQHEHKNTAFN